MELSVPLSLLRASCIVGLQPHKIWRADRQLLVTVKHKPVCMEGLEVQAGPNPELAAQGLCGR